MKRSRRSNGRELKSRREVLRVAASAGVGVWLSGVLSSAKASPSVAKGRLLVTNKGDRTLSIVDPATHRQVAVIPEDGVTGHEVAASLDGKLAFVPIFGDAGVGKAGTDGRLIRVIDIDQAAIVGTVDLGRGLRPHAAVVCPRTGLLYVTTELANAVCIIDPTTLVVQGSIPTGAAQSHMLALSRDGQRGFTSNVKPGSVSVLDLQTRKLAKVIPVCEVTQRISLSHDDRLVFTSDQSTPRLAVIDAAALEFKQWVPLPGIGFGTASTADGDLLITLTGTNEVIRLDVSTMKVVGRLSVPKAPQEVLVRPDGAIAYVSCDASKQVAAIDLHRFAVETLIDVGADADGLAWAVG